MITFIHRLIRVTRQGLNVAKTFSYVKEKPLPLYLFKKYTKVGVMRLVNR